MTRLWNWQSLQGRLFGPLFGLLIAVSFTFGYLAWDFEQKLLVLGKQITLNAEVSRHTITVIRTRARTQELLLLFRLNHKPELVPELLEQNRIRSQNLDRIQGFAELRPSLRSLGDSLALGLREATILQNTMLQAVKAQNLTLADEAFRQLSTIFEINSARLKDFTVRLENELRQDEARLKTLISRAIWILFAAVLLIAGTIWVIAVFYRDNLLHPLRLLHQGLKGLARGDLQSRIPRGNAPIELDEMIADFNQMVGALSKSQEQIRAALKLRDEFLSIASHELKTPLTSLKLQAELTKRQLQLSEDAPPIERRLQKLANQIDVQVERLNHLVEEMLDVSRIESGKLAPKMSRVDLNQLVKEVSESFAPQLLATGCTLRMKLHDELIGSWDPHRIEQIVVNLITNAMKYGAGKPIEIGTYRDGGKAVLSVSDKGIGIDPSHHDRIFERYERAVSTANISGLGLGLYIAKKIVTSHEGSIRVESELDRGARFVVELPLTPSVPALAGHPS